MRQNEIKGLVDSGMSVADATAQIDGLVKQVVPMALQGVQG
jgi:hypothetical protein